MSNIALTLPAEALDLIAARVVELLAEREPAAVSEWLNVAEAAEYLRCSKQRIYDLSSDGRLRVAKDGTRSLFRREWLDEYLETQ